jgi:hypothetical protein
MASYTTPWDTIMLWRKIMFGQRVETIVLTCCKYDSVTRMWSILS